MSLSRWTSINANRAREIDPLAEIAHDLEQPFVLVRASLAILVADPDANAVEDLRFVEVNSAVAAAVRSFAVTWPGRIATSFGEEVFVGAQPEMLHRSVRNVLANAGRAAGDQGAIVASVNTSPSGTSIAVEDDGPGFGAISARHSIGLEIVDRTMVGAGGSLCVRTSDLLGGACVELFFPAIREEVSIE